MTELALDDTIYSVCEQDILDIVIDYIEGEITSLIISPNQLQNLLKEDNIKNIFSKLSDRKDYCSYLYIKHRDKIIKFITQFLNFILLSMSLLQNKKISIRYKKVINDGYSKKYICYKFSIF